MDIRNCSNCGRVYVYNSFNVCPRCRKHEEKDFQKVKKYIDENQDANTSEVSEETEVPVRKIIDFLKEGRLEIKNEDNAILSCEKCGKSIRTGRFCDKCILDMDREFNRAIGRAKDVSELQSNGLKEKMQVKDRYKKR